MLFTLLQELGWQQSDDKALCPSVMPEVADAAPAKARSAAKKTISADKKAAPAAEASVTTMVEESVTGLDVPCHVAAISSHQAAMQQLAGSLTAAVAAFKSEMYSWQRNEQANKERWTGYLAKLQELK